MYSYYFNNFRSIGKILFCLNQTGIPIHIVESVTVTHVNDDLSYINYGSERIADITWDGNIPIFDFANNSYRQLIQPKYYKLFVNDKVVLEFNSKQQLEEYKKTNLLNNYDIKDILLRKVNDQLELLAVNETDINEKFNRLQKHFHRK